MQGHEHDYTRCTTPAQERRGMQKRIIEQVEKRITKLSLEQLKKFNDKIYDIKI